MGSLTAVYLHEGNQDYLKIAILSSKKVGIKAVLLGDESNKSFCDKWRLMSNYEHPLYKKFCENYTHYSSNGEEFELRCFKRYFTLLKYMENENLNEVLMLDSDTIFVYPIPDNYFSGVDVALSIHERQDLYRWSICPHCSYWTYSSLKEFVEFIVYTYKENDSSIVDKWKYHKENNIKGGICDMTLLYLWSVQTEKKILNTAIAREGYVIDNSFSSSENYTDDEYSYSRLLRIKRLKKVNGKLYFTKKDGEIIRPILIHCQGGAKNLMKSIIKNNIFEIRISRIIFIVKRVLGYA